MVMRQSVQIVIESNIQLRQKNQSFNVSIIHYVNHNIAVFSVAPPHLRAAKKLRLIISTIATLAARKSEIEQSTHETKP